MKHGKLDGSWKIVVNPIYKLLSQCIEQLERDHNNKERVSYSVWLLMFVDDKVEVLRKLNLPLQIVFQSFSSQQIASYDTEPSINCALEISIADPCF